MFFKYMKYQHVGLKYKIPSKFMYNNMKSPPNVCTTIQNLLQIYVQYIPVISFKYMYNNAKFLPILCTI